MVARPFKTGTTTKSFMHRSATPWVLVASFSGIKTPAYHRTSLREQRNLCFAAERHFMVARPFKAGTITPAIDIVAERQLIRDRRQTTTKSCMLLCVTPWILVASFRGTTLHPRGQESGFAPEPAVPFDEPERRLIRHESPSRWSTADSRSEISADP